jgi:pimeloyl-ACP methyl ester carboxylesterase
MTHRQTIRRRVPLDEGHLGYLVRPAPGPTLILIPGSFSDSTAWDDVAAALPNNISQIIIELPGHGDSWPPAREGSIERFARDVLLVVDDLDLERFFIGGHSIGGMVALQVASLRPGAVRGVISIEGWTSHQAARDAFAGDMDSTLSPDQRARKAGHRAAVTARWTQAQIEAFAKIWTHWDGYAFLAATDVPILQFWGDRGRPKPTLDRLRIPARPNIEVRWAENASHSLPLERPKELAEAIAAFIHNVETGGDSETRDSR